MAKLGVLVNRTCPNCQVPLVVGDVWEMYRSEYVRKLVCPECSTLGDDGGYFDDGFSASLPEDVRLRLGRRGYRRAPMLPMEGG